MTRNRHSGAPRRKLLGSRLPSPQSPGIAPNGSAAQRDCADEGPLLELDRRSSGLMTRPCRAAPTSG
eukprot:6988747-Pyramimonas_sp.AAC.1